MPLGAPVSTSFQPRALITPKTPNPAVGPSSGYRPPIPTVAPSVIVGASFTAVTVIDAVSVAVLKAVLPPVVLTSTVLPAEPVLWSQARKARLPSAPFIASGTKRTRSAARSSRAEVSATAPTLAQVVPLSSEYCQVPLPVVTEAPVTAIPSTAPASTSVMRSPPALAMISATVLPVLVVWSSVMAVSVISPLLSSTGASFTGVTVRLAVSVAVLKAVLPPLTLVLARAPLVPLVRSQARKVMASARVPFQLATGWKARRVAVSAASRRAEASLTAPRAFQVSPLSVEYHHEPLAVFAAVTAMPVRAPLSGSVTLSSPPAGKERSTSDATRVPTAPPGGPASSRRAFRVGDFNPSRAGAVLVGATAAAAFIDTAPISHCEEVPEVPVIVTDAAPASVVEPPSILDVMSCDHCDVCPEPTMLAPVFFQYCTSNTTSPVVLSTVTEAVVPVPVAPTNFP